MRSGVKYLIIAIMTAVMAMLLSSCNTEIEPISFSEAEITVPGDDIIARAEKGTSYEGNDGYEGKSVVISPYYSLTAGGKAVECYAALSYVGEDSSGALHSFAFIEGKGEVDIELKSSVGLESCAILPAFLGEKAEVEGNLIKAKLGNGCYTFITDEGDQKHSFTLFYREYRDEEKEIEALREKYGDDSLLVFEAGVHEIDYIEIEKSGYAIYLKKGAYLLAKDSFDIASDEDNTTCYEEGAVESNGFGLSRYPFITADEKEDIVISGSGIIDLGQLDWHERRGIAITNSKDISISGITIVNMPEWALICYQDENVSITNVAMFGYRTNSDCFAVCNSENVSVKDCFARSGDDMFEAKTLGGNRGCNNVSYENCYAWGGKARCFGVTGEVNFPISGISFKNCAVLYRDATWDNDRIGSLVVIVESGGADISDISFSDIEIYRDIGRAINITLTNYDITDCNISDIRFKNITCGFSGVKPAFQSGALGNTICASFENVTIGGVKLTSENVKKLFYFDERCSLEIK